MNTAPYRYPTICLGLFLTGKYPEGASSHSFHLELTGHHLYFSEIADLEIKRACRFKRPVSLAYIDIDNFKHVNDTRGHKEGDRLLQVAAYSLQKSIRISDMVARVGGDEFVVLFTETDYESAETAVNRIRNELLSAIQENKWPVTASIGLATSNNSECNFDELLTKADDLMYSVKKAGKNKVKHAEV